MQRILFFLTLFILCSFTETKPKPEIRLSNKLKNAKHYKLLPDLEVIAPCDGKLKDSEMDVFTGFAILLNNKIVYQDTTFSSFITKDGTFEGYAFNNTTYQVFLPQNFLPVDIRQLSLTFKDGELQKKETIPMFLNNGTNLDEDTFKEYAGVNFNSTELPCLSAGTCDSIWYWPILVYEKTNTGFQVDTSLTKKETEFVYGSFHGFQNDEKIILPVYQKFQKETDRLRKLK